MGDMNRTDKDQAFTASINRINGTSKLVSSKQEKVVLHTVL